MREYSEGAYVVSRSSRRSTGRRRRGAAGLLVGALIILTAGICLLVVFLPRLTVPTAATGGGFSGKTFYMLDVGAYDTYSDASLAARDAMNKGGAGYIYNDGKYRIIAAVYERETDAAALASVNENAHYFPLTVPAASVGKADGAALDHLVGEWFSAVYGAATELDRGNVTEAAAEYAALCACRKLESYVGSCGSATVEAVVSECADFDYSSSYRGERSALSYLRFLTVRAVASAAGALGA